MSNFSVSSLRQDIDNLIANGAFPSGTRILFQQSTAPVGWTKDTTHNNKALRIVSGTVSSGGVQPFTTAFASKGVSGSVGSTTLSTSQMPSHSHSVTTAVTQATDGVSGTALVQTSKARPPTTLGMSVGAQGGSGSHNHSFSGTAIDMRVLYVDVIIATKD